MEDGAAAASLATLHLPSSSSSISVLLPQPRAQPEHELDALELVEPVLQGGGQLARVGRGDGDGAGGAELLFGQGPITRQRAVAQGGAEFEILGHEDRDRNPIAGVDAKLLGEVLVLVAIDQAQVE